MRKTQIVFLAAAAFVGVVCVVLATSSPSPARDSIPKDSSSTVDSNSNSPLTEAPQPISVEARKPVDVPPFSHPLITGVSQFSFGVEIFSSPRRLCGCGKRSLLSTSA
jgi:hypothetical protein